ncbi:MAG: hypothetical protein J6W71_05510 [Methanobrevibacter sp.]|nr:hypothetical protein [Methanobrevibacter sp.]
MKKIVGILAAAAVAASAFAVDFSAGMQLKGKLFNYDGASKKVDAMQLWNENGKDDKPFIFSLSSDRVGATLKLWDEEFWELPVGPNSWDDTFPAQAAGAWNIWFKPFDNVKVELGALDTKLNCEQITWWKGKVLGGANWGYKAYYEADGLTIAAALGTGRADKAAWLSKADGGDLTLGETDVYVAYAADFGKISALFVAKDTFKDIAIGAGFSGSADSIGYFFDAAFHKGDKNSVLFDADVKYNQDALSAEVYAQAELKDLSNVDKDNMAVIAMAKVAYAVDGGSVYFKFRDDNLLADPADIEFIEVGFDGNLGAMSYEVAAQVQLKNEKINFGIPFYARIGF